jgi:hypothetical protein
MNKKIIISTSALLCLLAASCHKKQESSAGQPQASVSSSEAKLTAAYGFAAQTPKDAEGYVAVYGLKKLWQDFHGSKAAKALLANPSVQNHLADPSLRAVIDGAKQTAGVQNLRPLISDVLGEEAFVIFAPGSAEKLQAFQRFSNALRIEGFKSNLAQILHSQPEDKLATYLTLYKANADSLHIPPMIFGGKVLAQKAALVQQLGALEKKLPPGVEVTAFNLNGNLPFKSLVFSLSKLLPTDRQDQLKKLITSKISDPKAAEEVFQSIIVRKIEVAYGFAGDYFLVSVGNDHAHLKLAANFGDSLIAQPELAVAGKFADKPILSFSWCDKAFGALSMPHYKLSALYARLKSEIDASLPGIDSKKLEADLARIDEKGARVFDGEVDPMVGVSYRDRGIFGETFGGPRLHAFSAAKPLKFAAVPADSTFFWMDAQRDPAARAAAWDWIEDLTATGYDLFVTVGVPKLNDQQRMGFGMFQNLALPKLIELYHITRDQFCKSLGNESALAVDLGGEMPQIPMVPQTVLDNGKMLRLAVVKDVQDRKLLAQSWESYFKLARDVALLIPQTAQMPGGLPGPKSETADGVTLSYYPLPLPTGDLVPTVATTDTTLVMSTSQKYSVELSKAASKPAPAGGQPMAIDVRVNPKAACDFLDKWMAVVAANPDLFFPGKPERAEEFKKRLPAISALIQSARSVSGIECQVFEEKGQRRTTTRIGWKE